MWRYLKAAFLVGVDVPGLGRLPVNVLAVAAVAIFGAIEPSVWLAGGGLEVALLASLAFSPRFQKIADGLERQRRLPVQNAQEAQAAAQAIAQAAARTASLVAGLPPDLHFRWSNLRGSSARVLAIYRSLGFDEETIERTKASLAGLERLFLKLLVARSHLERELDGQTLPELDRRIAQLGAGDRAGDEVATGFEPDSLKRSRAATLDLLRKRAENLRSRDRLMEETGSDLDRIEAQVELMREQAAIHGKPYGLGVEIDLASDLAELDGFGGPGMLLAAESSSRGEPGRRG